MGEVIRSWLRSRLGVMIDLTPEVFGHYSRDGTLLAKLLYSYDIINDTQLNTIIQTQDPALARVNLKHLRAWIRFIGVDINNDCLEDISNGRGTASLQVFYKLFLCLETKDRLHFITLQREREKYIPTSTKFDVRVIPEEPKPPEVVDHPLSAPLITNASVIECHRRNFLKLIEDYKRQKEQLQSSLEDAEDEKPSKISAEFEKFDILEKKRILEEEKAEVAEFTTKHQKRNSECVDAEISGIFYDGIYRDPGAAKKYIRELKRRKKQKITTEASKIHSENSFLSSVWEKIESDQEKQIDEIISRKVLSECQYEKQMIKKLLEIRKERDRISENRRLVECLMHKAKEQELRMAEGREEAELRRENKKLDDESRRLVELSAKLSNKKLQKAAECLQQLGKQITNDFTDIAVSLGEYELLNNNQLPKKIWIHWKSLFFKGLSILEPDDILDLDRKSEEEGEKDDEVAKSPELIRRDKVLDERDLENYLDMSTPWDEFIPEVKEESQKFLILGLKILGRIVHKLLAVTYPSSCDLLPPPLHNVSIKAVLLGLPDLSSYPLLQKLLNYAEIKTVQIQDAINFCLQRYKEEMREFEFINLQSNDEEKLVYAQQKASSNLKFDRKVKTPQAPDVDKANGGKIIDKETQTPKSIPYEDLHPQLSNTAFVGKCLHELLTRGEKISDSLTATALVEYLESFKDIRGWVIIDYPSTYQQMINLESVLSGKNLLHPGNSNSKFSSIEEMDARPSRVTVSLEEESDEIFKYSRLVPNPLAEENVTKIDSHLTSFIRMEVKAKNDAEVLENIENEENDLNIYYIDQGIASIFYYTSCDRETLTQLCRFIIGNEIGDRAFSEIFGDASDILEEAKINGTSIKKLERSFESLESFESVHTRSSIDKDKLQPGESGWRWIDLPQDKIISAELGLYWEHLETHYINDVTEILSLKRFTFLSVLPYKNFIMKYLCEFITRSDDRQELLREFQTAYNDIPVDMRDDAEVKCELHCRVRDFQTQLWEICDSKRRESEEKRRRMICEDWTTMHVVILANIYLALMQVELNRFVDTLQVIEGYYLLMMQKPVQFNRFPKPVLQRIHFSSNEIDENELHNSSRSAQEKVKSPESSKGQQPIKSPPLPELNEPNLRSEIEGILLDKNLEAFDSTQISIFKIIKSNLNFCTSLIEDTLASALESLKKDDKKSKNPQEPKKGKKRLSKGSSKASVEPKKFEEATSTINDEKLEHLFEEWRYALMYEYTRVNTRLKILESAIISDIEFLLTTIQHGFYLIDEKITEIYRNSMKSINEMANIFGLAIEHKQAIPEAMIFDGDRFLVHLNLLKQETFPELPSSFPEEESKDLKFKITQLGRLKDIFQRVAPSGYLSQLSFTYILQDVIICSGKETEEPLVPPLWFKLSSSDIVNVIHEIFGECMYVDWREFLIYGIDIKIPTKNELLDTLENFRKRDKTCSGIILKSIFFNVPLWFNESLLSPSISSWLHDNFEVDEYEVSNEQSDIESSRAHSVSTKSRKKSISFGIESMERKHLGIDEVTPEDVRLNLVKQLLCEVFLETKDYVNYVKLLLSYCKDEDPKVGLAKALSVTMNCKICDDFEEGERFVQRLLEEKKQCNILRAEAIKINQDILEEMINDIFDYSKNKIAEMDDVSVTRTERELRHSGQILIERLDNPGETIDPSSLAEANEKSSVSSKSSTKESEDFSVSQLLNNEITSENGAAIKETTYWISTPEFERVLMELNPHLVDVTDIFYTGKSLRQNLELIYDEVKCEELNDTPEMVLAHRVMNHEFISLLLEKSMKFMWRDLGKIVGDIIKQREKKKRFRNELDYFSSFKLPGRRLLRRKQASLII